MKGTAYLPGYVHLHHSGELKRRGESLWEMLHDCTLCPRLCRVDRQNGEKGFCKATSVLRITSASAHFGEERGLVGYGGSGTIFLSHCNLGCVFCQNSDISHLGAGSDVGIEDLAGAMVDLQNRSCSNINMVTPTHFSPHILLALDHAASKGLRIPLVYNTCGWERIEILEILVGIVDIYLADFKYQDDQLAKIYSGDAEDYATITKMALKEMHRQVGIAFPEENGLINRGLMIRHLVMPGNVAGSLKVMDWIAENLPHDTYVNIMFQYRPAYRARMYPEINRSVTPQEYNSVVARARERGLTNLDVNL